MPKLSTLQSLRAIAALLVVFDHTAGAAGAHAFPQIPLGPLGLFFGAQGVAIFFLISGFIMVYTADVPQSALPARSRSRALGFAARRIVRVVPLYWFFTLLIVLIASLIGLDKAMDITSIHLVESLLFIPYRNFHGNLLPILPMGWTLVYEMSFYALFTAILLLPYRYRILSLFSILATTVAIGSFFYPIASGINPRSPGEFLTHPIILLFGLGAVLGWLRLRYPAFTVRVPALLPVIPLLALNSVIVQVVHRDPVPLSWTALFWLIDAILVALCVFGRPTKWPALEALGNASYSLYLAHVLPMFFVYSFWEKGMHFKAPFVFMALALTLSIATGLATYRWIERPLTRVFSRLILHRPAHPPSEPTPEPIATTGLAKAYSEA